jgi:hypothetical protein
MATSEFDTKPSTVRPVFGFRLSMTDGTDFRLKCEHRKRDTAAAGEAGPASARCYRHPTRMSSKICSYSHPSTMALFRSDTKQRTICVNVGAFATVSRGTHDDAIKMTGENVKTKRAIDFRCSVKTPFNETIFHAEKELNRPLKINDWYLMHGTA